MELGVCLYFHLVYLVNFFSLFCCWFVCCVALELECPLINGSVGQDREKLTSACLFPHCPPIYSLPPLPISGYLSWAEEMMASWMFFACEIDPCLGVAFSSWVPHPRPQAWIFSFYLLIWDFKSSAHLDGEEWSCEVFLGPDTCC